SCGGAAGVGRLRCGLFLGGVGSGALQPRHVVVLDFVHRGGESCDGRLLNRQLACHWYVSSRVRCVPHRSGTTSAMLESERKKRSRYSRMAPKTRALPWPAGRSREDFSTKSASCERRPKVRILRKKTIPS